MNENHQLLVDLLSAAINLSKVTIIEYENIDWNYIYEKAKFHQIHTILYPKLSNNNDFCCNDELLKTWKEEALLLGLNQLMHVRQIRNVLNKFNQSGISTVILKGLVLRDLYPYPDMRTMSDADLLVHMEDVEKAKKILLDMGYYENHISSKDIEFCHTDHMPIELHWAVHSNYSKYSEYFEDNLWNNANPIKFLDIPALSLNLEFQLVHLCLHLLEHTIHPGFGLRQLCDIALFINSSHQTINWDTFFNIVKRCKLEKFTKIICSICSQIFNLNIPNILLLKDRKDIELVNIFIDIIISGGVFGKGDFSNSYNVILNQVSLSKTYKLKSKFLNYLLLLFPSPKRLDIRYKYAHKYFILLPIAWVHRITCILVERHYSINEYTSLLESRAIESMEKDDFIKWLHT